MFFDRNNRSTTTTSHIANLNKRPTNVMLPPVSVQQSNGPIRHQNQQQVIFNGHPARNNRPLMENGYVRQGALQAHRFQPQGRGPSPDLPVRMLVNAKYIGALIGQGGANIRQISKDSKARCVVDVSRGIRESSGTIVEKAVNVYGMPENSTSACLKIFELVLREARDDPLNQGKNIESELKLLAHNNLVGRLIGKNGSSIKKIMEDTSCVIFLSNFADMTAFNMERTVTIRGQSVTNISHAEALISAKLRSSWQQDISNSMFATHPAAPMYNAASMHHPFIPPLTGGAPPFGAYGSGAAGRPLPPPFSANRAYVGGASPPTLAGGDSAASHQPPPMNRADVIHEHRTEVCYVWVPSAVVGALIGTKGSNIRQIMRLTGAHIRIDSPKPGAPENSDSAPDSVPASGGDDTEANVEAQTAPSSAKSGNGNKVLAIGGDRRVTITGPESQQYKCQFWIFQRICEQGYQFFDEIRLCTEVHVPSKVVGRLIGRKGQNVRELQRYTGAQVRIVETSRSGDTVTVDGMTLARITGNFNASQAVQNRIRQLIYQALMNDAHGGGAAHSHSTASCDVASLPNDDALTSPAGGGGSPLGAAVNVKIVNGVAQSDTARQQAVRPLVVA